MQSKGTLGTVVSGIIAIFMVIVCLFYMSFSFVSSSYEDKAEAHALAKAGKEGKESEAYNKAYNAYLNELNDSVVYLGYTLNEVRKWGVNLGLDLKGGMNVTIQMSLPEVVRGAAKINGKDENFEKAIRYAHEQDSINNSNNFISTFVDKYSELNPAADYSKIFTDDEGNGIKNDKESAKAGLKKIVFNQVSSAANVLRNRIDGYGVVSPNIQILQDKDGQVLLELPGVKDHDRVRDLLLKSAALEFYAAYKQNERPTAFGAITQLSNAFKADSVNAGKASLDSLLLYANAQASIAGYAKDDATKEVVNSIIRYGKAKQILPSDMELRWGVKKDKIKDESGKEHNLGYALYVLKSTNGKPALDGDCVVDASTERDDFKGYGVSMTMNGEGAKGWARVTGNNVGNQIAIVLDSCVYSAPNVENAIEGGRSSITGNFTPEEAQDLANVLSSGKVPAPAKIIQDTVVGPSLGQESINAGLLSFVVAFILVLLYMGLFYKTAGWVSDIALLFNVFLLMGVLVSFGAVLTLPGIAGIVLTMGMAVDANVIIYERIKEELREGKGLSLAIKDGFSKAYSAIIDGQLTTIITGIVLFVFGTGPVQGFATTLVIGIITSVFTAVFITRILLEWAVAKFGSVSFSRPWSENFLQNTKIDFLSKRKVAYITVAVVLGLSCISFAVRGLNLGAEFTGGRAYVVRFDQAVEAEQVRENLAAQFATVENADASSISYEVKQYGGENQMRIVTQYRFDDTSDDATAEVEEILYNAVKGLYTYDITFDQFRDTQTDENGILNADKIGPSIAKDTTWNAIYSVLFSLIAIGLYITLRFKRWQWALGATFALAVNAFMIIGIYSIFYGLLPFNLEVNQAFIAAILTIIGYAINDTVVVFDRIREFLGLYPKRAMMENVNKAINSTLSRTINTSATTLVTLIAIFLFGGETIRGFVFALILGVCIGTAATIFVATPIAYDLMTRADKKKELKK